MAKMVTMATATIEVDKCGVGKRELGEKANLLWKNSKNGPYGLFQLKWFKL